MQSYRANIVLYAENEQEVKAFEAAFYKLVDGKRLRGIPVTAQKLTQAIQAFSNNPYIDTFLTTK